MTADDPQAQQADGLFDGEILRRNLNRFLGRMNNALKDSRANLPDFDVKQVTVALSVGVGGEVGFVGTGLHGDRTRTLEFILTPKP